MFGVASLIKQRVPADRDEMLGGVGNTHVAYLHVYTSNMAFLFKTMAYLIYIE